MAKTTQEKVPCPTRVQCKRRTGLENGRATSGCWCWTRSRKRQRGGIRRQGRPRYKRRPGPRSAIKRCRAWSSFTGSRAESRQKIDLELQSHLSRSLARFWLVVWTSEIRMSCPFLRPRLRLSSQIEVTVTGLLPTTNHLHCTTTGIAHHSAASKF